MRIAKTNLAEEPARSRRLKRRRSG